MTLYRQLLNDEAGFVVSAELILIVSIGVLSLIVGISEVSTGVNHEFEDMGSAFGSVNQTYVYYGVAGHGGAVGGGRFRDHADFCDREHDIVRTRPVGEKGDFHYFGRH